MPAMIPCLNPRLCGVRNHHPNTVVKCRQGATKSGSRLTPPLPQSLGGTERSWGEVGISVGSRTPWGPAQHVDHVAPGFVQVDTEGHGGVKLSPERNRMIPAPLRRSSGWYEEDCEANIAMAFFPEEYAEYRERESSRYAKNDKWSDPDFVRENSMSSIREWYPDEYEKVTGEVVTAEQSHVRAAALFHQEHENDLVGVSASRSTEHPGMVEVTCTKGGRHDKEAAKEKRVFLVSKEEYAPGRFGFVVDPSRHQDITPAPAPPKPALPRFRDATIDSDSLTPAARRQIDKDLGQRWRTEDGAVRTLRELIEQEGVTGKNSHYSDGKTDYYLEQREKEGGSYVALKVSKATFQALSGVPDSRSEREIANQEVVKTRDAYEKASRELARSRHVWQERDALMKAEARAKSRYDKARAAFQEISDRERTQEHKES